jgi:hypothetical protein
MQQLIAWKTNSTPQDLCDENHKQRMKARVQDLFSIANNNPPEQVRSSDIQNLIKFKTEFACGNDASQMHASSTFQEDHWYLLHIY